MGGKEQESPYVEFARRVVESYVREGSTPPASEAPVELQGKKAGVFVSLKKRGALRGCIGTIHPLADNVAEEIRSNAVSSATTDSRFPPVTAEELDDLEYSVDVLEEAEDIEDIGELDPSVYGVIVRSGGRSGLLLPDLEGVDTPEEQVRISMMKAGIRPDEPVSLQRFKVSRYK
ncbi:MAG: AmmeMemoRadiSam system protein A [Actinomycetia bacterium]|nr:AmmeMemoRadiSam system protein A [Actinomycetota bacterium]MBU4302132.1 AmmeMemoRadiSam system protein A [Actinomycetota bacterium]MCG2794961.1 AmmeMemoRadiSam system protein A [Actinomycetes bacterium]